MRKSIFLIILSAFFFIGCYERKETPPPPAPTKQDIQFLDRPNSKADSEPAEMPEEGSEMLIDNQNSTPPAGTNALRPQPVATTSSTQTMKQALDSTLAAIQSDLQNEQNAFFSKQITEMRGFYTGPNGEMLLPAGELEKILKMMDSRFPIKLTIIPERFNLLLPMEGKITGAQMYEADRPLLGTTLKTTTEYSDKVSLPTVRMGAKYTYKVDAGALAKESVTETRTRYLLYQKIGNTWERLRVEEP